MEKRKNPISKGVLTMEENKTLESVNTQELADPADDKVFVDDNVEEIEASESTQEDISQDDNSEDVKVEESEKTQEVAKPVDKPKQADDENSKYAAARRDAEKQVQEMQKKQDEFAKSLGYNSFEEMQNSHLQQKYIEEGYDEQTAERMVRFDKMEREMLQEKNKARIATEKLELKSQRFFSDLEPDIDEYLQKVPDANVKVIFDMLKGQKVEELIEKASKSTKQKTLNSLNNKNHVKSDGKGVDHNPVHVDPDEFAFYKKLNPRATMQEYAKFKKSNN